MKDTPKEKVNATPKELQPDEKWRKTRWYDVTIAGSGIVVFLLFLLNTFVNPKASRTQTIIFVVLWFALFAIQTRTFLVVLRKYRNGEFIRRGFFGNVLETRK